MNLKSKRLLSVDMDDEKCTLTWPSLDSYTNHFQKVLGNLLSTGDSSDVTLVCDDQGKFNVHKFVLKSCSPIFEGMLQTMNDPLSKKSKSIIFQRGVKNFTMFQGMNNIIPTIYLRGVNSMELKLILEFIYCGQTTFQQERMKELFSVGTDLQITGIFVPDESNVTLAENLPDESSLKAEQNVTFESKKEIISKKDSRINDTYESDSQETTTKSNQEDKLVHPIQSSIWKSNLKELTEYVHDHEGKKYSCDLCSYKATQKVHLRKHMESTHIGTKLLDATSVLLKCQKCAFKTNTYQDLEQHTEVYHEVVVYPCYQCTFKAKQPRQLKIHIASAHKGVKYPCLQCDFEASWHQGLKAHIELNH